MSMERFTIRFVSASSHSSCPMCGQGQHGRQGPCVFAEDHDTPLCRPCGKKMVPSMVALLDLALAAEKVGRLCRHLLTPPMASLLDLARAAENYSETSPPLHAAAVR